MMTVSTLLQATGLGLLLRSGVAPAGLDPGAAPVVATAPNTSLDTIPVAYFGGHHSNCTFSTQ